MTYTPQIPFVFPARSTQWSCIVREAPGYLSREEGVVAGGLGFLLGNLLMGRILTGDALIPSAVAQPGNTGNGVASAMSVSAGADQGQYRVEMLDANRFSVFGPEDGEVGRGHVGAAFAGPINFLLSAGATPFAAGDEIVINAAFQAGSGQYVPWDPTATDGAEVFAGIMLEDCDTTKGPVKRTVLVRQAEVQQSQLSFALLAGGAAPTPDQMAVCFAQMARQVIVLR